MAIKTGQVWKNKTTEEKICILGMNPKANQIWVCGCVDQVNPIWELNYLLEKYELLPDWTI